MKIRTTFTPDEALSNRVLKVKAQMERNAGGGITLSTSIVIIALVRAGLDAFEQPELPLLKKAPNK